MGCSGERIDGIRGIAWIDAVDWVEWILGINGVDGIQGIVRTVLIDRIKDVVVALVLLREARIGEYWCDGERQDQKKDENPHGEPPKSQTTSGLSLFSVWRTAQAGQRRLLKMYSPRTLNCSIARCKVNQ